MLSEIQSSHRFRPKGNRFTEFVYFFGQFYEDGVLTGPVVYAADYSSTGGANQGKPTAPGVTVPLLAPSGRGLTQYNGPPCPAYHNPCLNSQCVAELDDFECICPNHFTGKRCEICKSFVDVIVIIYG
jgi:hypothetical protein